MPRSTHRLIRPIQEFIRLETSGGILLLAAAVLALAWANSPFADHYFALWKLPLRIQFAEGTLEKTLGHAINDGLMAIFFFLVGLEIKREFAIGDLSERDQAALPIVAAIGGMVVPALIYAAFNRGGAGAAGWGIPMATDIAFALGIMALLGPRAPLSLKVFLAALAIVDDMGAVLVIALFYTKELSIPHLAGALGLLVALVLASRAGLRSLGIYGFAGIFVWFLFLKSGVHATVAGVLLALTIPIRVLFPKLVFIEQAREILDAMEASKDDEEETSAFTELSQKISGAQIPVEQAENALHPWVTFLIVPLFAFANSGVALGEGIRLAGSSPIAWGTFFGLVIGKPLGIYAACALAIKLKIARLPAGVGKGHLFGAGCLAGVGFTMALFIGELAFGPGEQLEIAKTSILLASLVSGVIGYVILSRSPVRSRTASRLQKHG